MTMLIHETVQRCERCEAVTPHSRRRVAWPRVVSALLVALAVGLAFQGGLAQLGGGLALGLGVLLWSHDGERCWGIHCERCRAHARFAIQRTKPRLGGSTEILFHP